MLYLSLDSPSLCPIKPANMKVRMVETLQKKAYTVQEVAFVTGLHESTVLKLIAEESLPAVR